MLFLSTRLCEIKIYIFVECLSFKINLKIYLNIVKLINLFYQHLLLWNSRLLYNYVLVYVLFLTFHSVIWLTKTSSEEDSQQLS